MLEWQRYILCIHSANCNKSRTHKSFPCIMWSDEQPDTLFSFIISVLITTILNLKDLYPCHNSMLRFLSFLPFTFCIIWTIPCVIVLLPLTWRYLPPLPPLCRKVIMVAIMNVWWRGGPSGWWWWWRPWIWWKLSWWDHWKLLSGDKLNDDNDKSNDKLISKALMNNKTTNTMTNTMKHQ